MTFSTADDRLHATSGQAARFDAAGRDLGIDTMRGLAVLMVIGIHSLTPPLNSVEILVDAALRPCVPIFLFVSGYFSARSGRIPLRKRLQAALIPYSIAFVAAYIYMALHNLAMDHRPMTTLARFLFAYVFVYYYVFVYIGCTILLWLMFAFVSPGTERQNQRVAVTLLLATALGLVAGSYLDPLLSRLGFADSLIEEARMRDLPFWFSFMAVGVLAGMFGTRSGFSDMQPLFASAALLAYAIYAGVRLFHIGDAADYDSVAYFAYAIPLCCLLLGQQFQLPAVAWFGSGSYFIYLWHIVFVMILRDHAPLRQFGPVASSAITFAVATTLSAAALLAVRQLAPPRLRRWLGA